MKAIILAAGRGSRMGDLTEEHPKCLTKLSGATLLDRQIGTLRRAGIDQISIVTGYLKESLERFAPKTFENLRWRKTNMVVSLRCAREWLKTERCIISYSDIFYESSAILSLLSCAHDLCISYDPNWLQQWSARFSDPLSDAETFRINSNGEILEIGERATSIAAIQGQFMGLLAITPLGWSIIEEYLTACDSKEIDCLDMTGLLSRLIADGNSIKGVPYQGTWGEIDNANDLALFEKLTMKD